MARTQSELFENATQIAEGKIRQARSMQSNETRDMVKQAWKAFAAKFQRSDETAPRNADA